jgi:hypothetical protein
MRGGETATQMHGRAEGIASVGGVCGAARRRAAGPRGRTGGTGGAACAAGAPRAQWGRSGGGGEGAVGPRPLCGWARGGPRGRGRQGDASRARLHAGAARVDEGAAGARKRRVGSVGARPGKGAPLPQLWLAFCRGAAAFQEASARHVRRVRGRAMQKGRYKLTGEGQDGAGRTNLRGTREGEEARGRGAGARPAATRRRPARRRGRPLAGKRSAAAAARRRRRAQRAGGRRARGAARRGAHSRPAAPLSWRTLSISGCAPRSAPPRRATSGCRATTPSSRWPAASPGA